MLVHAIYKIMLTHVPALSAVCLRQRLFGMPLESWYTNKYAHTYTKMCHSTFLCAFACRLLEIVDCMYAWSINGCIHLLHVVFCSPVPANHRNLLLLTILLVFGSMKNGAFDICSILMPHIAPSSMYATVDGANGELSQLKNVPSTLKAQTIPTGAQKIQQLIYTLQLWLSTHNQRFSNRVYLLGWVFDRTLNGKMFIWWQLEIDKLRPNCWGITQFPTNTHYNISGQFWKY